MVLKFKNTEYTPVFSKTNNANGLIEPNFWININLILKNEDIDFHGDMTGMSFEEIKKWNEMNKSFINGTMKRKTTLKFIKRFGEIVYYPDLKKVEKRLFIYDELNKHYSIYFDMDELKEIVKNNQEFIDKVNNEIA